MSESSTATFINEKGILHYKAGEFADAMSCWEEAAKLGDSSAMFGLGVIYLNGNCVSKDVAKARTWFEKAAKSGHKNALKQIEKLDTEETENYTSIKKPCEQIEKLRILKQPTVKFGDYVWIVLNKQNSKILCISKDVIDVRRYNEECANVTWETCTLRKWLNNEFLSRFSLTEQEQICETEMMNANNPVYDTVGGNDTRDRVFLLSLEEVVKYFGDDGTLKHAKDLDLLINNNYDEVRIANLNMALDQLNEANKCYGHDYSKTNGKSIGWWLRTPGSSSDRATRINCNGAMRVHGRSVNYNLNGIRPVFWMNINENKSGF